MKSKYLPLVLTLMLCGSATVWAQPKVDGSPKTLLKGEGVQMSPKWSPDGSQIAVTSLGYDGIWVADANGKNLKKVTTDAGAGYKFSWSQDNKTILARTNVKENNRVLHEVKVYNVEDQSATVISKKTREIEGLPYWSSDNSKISYKENAQVRSAASGKVALRSAKADSKAVQLVRRIEQDPAGLASQVVGLISLKGSVLFNAVASPQGDKVVFQAGGKGLFVCDADGNNLKNIGRGIRAAWMPDGKYVIASLVTDDGEVITGGILNAVNVETGEYHQLTDQSYIALSPAVTTDGSKLAFEEYASGNIYVVNLK